MSERRRDLSHQPERFPYYRSVAPLLWALVAIGGTELVVEHFLLWLWKPLVAAAISALTLVALGWLVLTICSMRRLPVELGEDTLVMRVGILKAVSVPLANVAGLRSSWDAETLKRPSVRNFALLSYPNIVVDLKEPLPDRRGTAVIAHRLDDPAGFARSMAKRLG